MGYQVLARKWRPKIFREMIGQEHVLKTLINALDHDRLHHAYLFTGTRGVGKTTIARILSKCLNCETGVSSEPCGQCGTCKEVDEGRFIDLIEVDAASRTKVEDTRELLDNVQYAPTRGRYKVYLIDEVHMLSTHSFNALLKTLEEPPPHVKFLLATTDPQKLPATILSRCLQFSLKNMPPQHLVEHLTNVLSKEMVEFEEAALWELGRAADGSVRDAMSLTDQAIAFGNGRITTADVRTMLGTIDRTYVLQLIEAIAVGDVQKTLDVVEEASNYSPDYLGILSELVATLHRVAIGQALPQAIDNSLGDGESITRLAKTMTAEDLQLYYQIALIGRKDLPLNPDARAGLEMVLLRMLLFKPAGVEPAPGSGGAGPGAGTQSRLQKMGHGSSPANNMNSVNSSSQVNSSNQANRAEQVNNTGQVNNVNPVNSESVQQPSTQSAATQVSATVDNAPVPGSGREKMLAARALLSAPAKRSSSNVAAASANVVLAPESVAPAPASAAIQPAPAVNQTVQQSSVLAEAPVMEHPMAEMNQVVESQQSNKVVELVKPKESVGEDYQVDDEWFQLVTKFGITGNLLNMARNCSMESHIDNHFVLALDHHYEALLNNDRIQRLQNAMSTYYKAAVTLKIDIAMPSNKTPDEWAEDIRQKKLVRATAILHADPVVVSLKQRFNAVIDPESIKPKL